MSRPVCHPSFPCLQSHYCHMVTALRAGRPGGGVRGVEGAQALLPVGQGGIYSPTQASRFTFLGLSFLVCTYFFGFMLRIQ